MEHGAKVRFAGNDGMETYGIGYFVTGLAWKGSIRLYAYLWVG